VASQVALVELDAPEFRERVTELLNIYVAAMNYPIGTGEARIPLWSDHSRRPDFRCVIAVDPADPRSTALGLAYGYRGLPGQWWHAEVTRGLTAEGRGWTEDYFELTELHVRPDQQGHGLGEALLRALLSDARGRLVLLSTPEGENRAWRLYRRVGFVDVLRNYRFTGDPRPFGVLGRALPLEPPG
jgi:ribosomal protein S18 acetylase RimI-like enzyme